MSTNANSINQEDQTYFSNITRILGGAGWFILGTIAGAFLEYIILGLLAFWLGPTEFGIFNIGVQIFNICLSLSILALPVAVARFIPEYYFVEGSRGLNQIISISLLWSLASSTLISAMLIILAEPISVIIFKENNLSALLQIFALTLPIAGILSLISGILRGLKQSQPANLLTLTYERALRLAFIAVFFLLRIGLRGAALAYLPASFLSTLFGGLYLRKWLSGFKFAKPDKRISRQVFLYSWPLMLSAILTRAKLAIQPLMLAYFLDTRAVGFFSVALLIAEFPSLVLTAFNFLYLPIVSGIPSEHDGHQQMRRLFRFITNWSLIIALPLMIMLFASPASFLAMFGPQYQEGSWTMRLLVVGSIVNVGFGGVGSTLLAKDQTRIYFFIDLLSTVFGFLFGTLLIPSMGLLGAAISYLLMVTLWNGIALYFVNKLYDIHPFNRSYFSILNIGLACFLPIYPVLQLFNHVPVWIIGIILPIYLILTILLLYQFHLLELDERYILDQTLNRIKFRNTPLRSRMCDLLNPPKKR